MKIIIFTIPDCYFSKQEKEYLNKHNLPFEERNLETNRDWLTEMLTISNNFAGTPVTKIEKNDGTIVVLKGFTKEEFDETLGIAPEDPVQTVPKVTPVVETEPVVPQAVVPPTPVVVPQVQNAEPAPKVETIPQTPDISAISAQIEELKKLQESLTQKSQSVQPQESFPTPQPIVPQAVVPPTPVVVPQVQNAEPAPPVAVDDSLAAILAELQAKINASNSGSSTGNSQPS